MTPDTAGIDSYCIFRGVETINGLQQIPLWLRFWTAFLGSEALDPHDGKERHFRCLERALPNCAGRWCEGRMLLR